MSRRGRRQFRKLTATPQAPHTAVPHTAHYCTVYRSPQYRTPLTVVPYTAHSCTAHGFSLFCILLVIYVWESFFDYSFIIPILAVRSPSSWFSVFSLLEMSDEEDGLSDARYFLLIFHDFIKNSSLSLNYSRLFPVLIGQQLHIDELRSTKLRTRQFFNFSYVMQSLFQASRHYRWGFHRWEWLRVLQEQFRSTSRTVDDWVSL